MGAASAPYLWPALGMLGSSAISAIAAPDGQELQSFDGEGPLDPKLMLGDAKVRLEDMMALLKDRANRPIQLRSAYVQQPPVFTGGGLPMPIGVAGMDPALTDPSLLRLPGLAGEEGVDFRAPRRPGDTTVIPDGSDPRQPQEPENGPYAASIIGDRTGQSGPARRQLPSASSARSLFTPTTVPNVSTHDDLAQGMGAVELLLRSLR